MLTRVISRPTPERVALDLGYKAVASDPPAGNRLLFPDLPDAKAVLQNEEHLVLETAQASSFQPGDEIPLSSLSDAKAIVNGKPAFSGEPGSKGSSRSFRITRRLMLPIDSRSEGSDR